MELLKNLRESRIGRKITNTATTVALAGTFLWLPSCSKEIDIKIDNSQLQAELDSLKRRQNEKDAHYEEALRQLREANERQDQEIDDLGYALRENWNSLKEEIASFQSALMSLENQNQQMTEDLNETRKMLDQRINSMHDKMETMQSWTEDMQKQIKKIKDGLKALATELQDPNSELNNNQLEEICKEIDARIKNYENSRMTFEFFQEEAFQKAKDVWLITSWVDDQWDLGLKDYPNKDFMQKLTQRMNTVYWTDVEVPNGRPLNTRDFTKWLLQFNSFNPADQWLYSWKPITLWEVSVLLGLYFHEVLDNFSNMTEDEKQQAYLYAYQNGWIANPSYNIATLQQSVWRNQCKAFLNAFCEQHGLDNYPWLPDYDDYPMSEEQFATILSRILFKDKNDITDNSKPYYTYHVSAMEKILGVSFTPWKTLTVGQMAYVMQKLDQRF